MNSDDGHRACILSTGSELIRGTSIDTNWRWIADRLRARGIVPVARYVIDDHLEAIVAALRCAAETASTVVMTGGLGPTHDDLTRRALAHAAGCQLETDKESLRRIAAFFERRGRRMSETNRVQAMRPAAGTAIPNTVGTAPGIDIRLGDCRVFALPGVPAEMKVMFEEYVAARLPAGGAAEYSEQILVFGEGESGLAERIADLLEGNEMLSTGMTARRGLITIRLTAAGEEAAARKVVGGTADRIRQRLGPLVLGAGETGMEGVLGSLLREAGQTLSTAESCTGGMIGQLLTSVPGSSEYYRGGMTAYSNELKTALLGVPPGMLAEHGAVSEAVAAAMAAGIREKTGSDWAIGVTGIAGPAGGTPSKPVGLVYTSLAGAGGTDVRHHLLPGDRTMIRRRAALAAMDALRLRLLDEKPPGN